jgi:hypothetical protein
MKWYVLKFGPLFVLLAIIFDVIDVALGGHYHWQTPSVFYFWMVVLALVTAFDFVVEHRHLNTIRSFSPLLDGGEKPEIAQGWDGTTLVTSIAGQYRGRLMGAKMWCDYLRRNPRVSVTIKLACKWPWAFSVERRTIGTRIMEAFGDMPTPPVGEAELDEELAISGDRSTLRLWLSHPETRRLVRWLTVEHHARLATGTQSARAWTSLARRAEDAADLEDIPSLQCYFSPYRWYYRIPYSRARNPVCTRRVSGASGNGTAAGRDRVLLQMRNRHCG